MSKDNKLDIKIDDSKETNNSQLSKTINKKYGTKTIYTLQDKEPVIAIPSLSYTLNYCSGIGGFAAGYIHEVYGDTGSGKTALTLGVLGNAQRMGMKCLYVDAENRLDIKRMMQLGVNPKTLLISHNNIIEQIFDIIIDVLQSREVQFVLLDSLATLMSEKEFESDMDSNDMGRKAQAIGKGIKKVVGTISQITAQHGQSAAPTFIMTNQIRESTSMYGASEAVPGGKAPKFFSSQRVRLQVKHFLDEKGKEYSKTSNAEIEETLVAAKIYHKHVKNTFAPPQRSGNYSLYWDDRVFEHVEELVNLGLSTGIIEQANGSWYEFGEHRLNGAKNVLAHFRDNKTSFNKLVQQLNLPKLWDREVGHEGVDLKEIGYGYEGKPEEEEY